MVKYTEMSTSGLLEQFDLVKKEYDAFKKEHLTLDMSRGKPGKDNMDLSEKLFDLVGNDSGFKNVDGIDCRNYGGLDGLTELKNLFAAILGMSPEQIIVGGNSSLNMMFDTVSQGMTHGLGDKPWAKQDGLKFLCPAPGYDRHFAITEYFGFELISVPLYADGPDMDTVEELVKDEKVKGIWCVPKYSNPEGITYSDETVRRFAALKPAAKDFHIFWDNAYAVHDLGGESDRLLNIYEECEKAGNPDLPIIFASTSKITFPGAGVAAEAGSPEVVAMLKGRMKFQTIGPDKLNQLRHARMFRSVGDITAHMRSHAEILRPKFQNVLTEFENSLSGLGIARWNNPKGGYFIAFDSLDGCAKRIIELTKEAGVVMTGAGATYPYHKDPHDSNIRIAPSYPSLEELKKAAEIFTLSVKLASADKILETK